MSWFVLACNAIVIGGLALVAWAAAETPAERWAAHQQPTARHVETEPARAVSTPGHPHPVAPHAHHYQDFGRHVRLCRWCGRPDPEATQPLRTVQPRGGAR